MKYIYGWLIFTISFFGCRKQELSRTTPLNPPPMDYFNLDDKKLAQGSSMFFDLNFDDKADIGFTTWYIGDPVEKTDKVLFFAGSFTHSLLLVGDHNNSPRFNKNDRIRSGNHAGYNWYEVSQVELAKKNTRANNELFWTGDWKDVSHKFLAIQVRKNGLVHTGWIELSFDTIAQNLIFHRAALSKVAETDVIAGN